MLGDEEVLVAAWSVEAEVVSVGLAEVVGVVLTPPPSHPHSTLKVVAVGGAAVSLMRPAEASDMRVGYLGYCESVGAAAGKEAQRKALLQVSTTGRDGGASLEEKNDSF